MVVCHIESNQGQRAKCRAHLVYHVVREIEVCDGQKDLGPVESQGIGVGPCGAAHKRS